LKNLDNKLVLITGGSSGIGRLMAINFSKQGSRIILWATDKNRLSRVENEIKNAGGQAWSYVCDVSDKNRISEVSGRVKKEIGKVDVLINNAGIVTGKPFLECSDEEIKQSMDVNIMAHFWTVRSFLPDMIKTNQGHLVTITSAAGLIGVNSLADYCSSKFASVGFDESIRMELRRKGIDGVKTTLVAPYYINTGMFDGVKSRFKLILPILDEHKVAQKIVHAVKKDQAVLKMPPIVYALPLLRLLPTKHSDKIMDILGINTAMDEFVGHRKQGSKF